MLKTLEIKNFTCFPEAKLEFSPGLKVIVGEKGTGKSHLIEIGICGAAFPQKYAKGTRKRGLWA